MTETKPPSVERSAGLRLFGSVSFFSLRVSAVLFCLAIAMGIDLWSSKSVSLALYLTVTLLGVSALVAGPFSVRLRPRHFILRAQILIDVMLVSGLVFWGMGLGVFCGFVYILLGTSFLYAHMAMHMDSALRLKGQALDQSERDLDLARELHHQTVSSIMSGLLTTDRKGRISSFNPEAEQITGISASSAVGCPLEDVVPGALSVVGELGYFQTRKKTRVRLEFETKAGDIVHLGVSASTLLGSDGRRRGWVLIFQDVTNVVRMEQELRNSERMAAVGEMAAKIAHEVRNPLASISGSIQLLLASGAIREEMDEGGRLSEIVVRETDRLNKLITDFLEYSRPMPPVFRELELNVLLADVLGLLKQSCPDNISLEFNVRGEVRAWADGSQLKQVIWNLAMNGIEAMPEGGQLAFFVREGKRFPNVQPFGERLSLDSEERMPSTLPHHWVEVEVCDSGSGVDPTVKDRIFEPFFTTKLQGSGLGLSTVHRAVEAHGGSIVVEDATERGTVFRFILPGVEEAA